MASIYRSVPTRYGQARLADALESGAPVGLYSMALGDGNGSIVSPNKDMKGLVNEVYHSEINEIERIDATTVRIALRVPSEVGGFTVREVGLFDDLGEMVAVGNYAATYKPAPEDGSVRELYVRMWLKVSNVDQVTITVDTSIIYATKEWVEAQIQAHAESRDHPDATTEAKGFVELASLAEAKARENGGKALTPETGGAMLAEHESAGSAHKASQIKLDTALSAFPGVSKLQALLSGLGSAATKDDGRYAHRSNNLSDLLDKAKARLNLGLGTAATQGDDRYAHRSSNLSDLLDKAKARLNLGLGTAAQENASRFVDREDLNLGSGTDNDPNTTLDEQFLTNHENGPGDGIYWHVTQVFYSKKTASSNRAQIAVAYNGNRGRVVARHYYGSDGWSPWAEAWTDKNQGSGSGLNADTVDGLHARSFMRSDSPTEINVGRGVVHVENNSGDNPDGAGLTLRTSENPGTGSPESAGSIFAVRSSGQALRLWVGQSVTSTGDNDFETCNLKASGTITGDGSGLNSVNADTVDGWHRDRIRHWNNIRYKPATATRWPRWNEVSGKPDLTQNTGAGQVGTYGIFVARGGARTPGHTTSGSSLRWSNAAGNRNNGRSPSGTWRLMGSLAEGDRDGESPNSTAIYLRIA